MEPYIHRVHYYETDKMGCVHHSNYIRWMEEARVDYLERIGLGFPKLEALGVYSPVVGVECRYRRPTFFDEEITVRVAVESCSGIRFRFTYEMTNPAGTLVATGASEHCFTDTAGRPIALAKLHPEIAEILQEQGKNVEKNH